MGRLHLLLGLVVSTACIVGGYVGASSGTRSWIGCSSYRHDRWRSDAVMGRKGKRRKYVLPPQYVGDP